MVQEIKMSACPAQGEEQAAAVHFIVYFKWHMFYKRKEVCILYNTKH